MDLSVLNYEDYRDYIFADIKSSSHIKGYRGQLANAAQCQQSYLSQALGGKVELTPEHAANLANHWKFSSMEKEYFLNLVNLSRAGTNTLKEIYKKRLAEIKKENMDFSKRYDNPAKLVGPNEASYYSHWHWAAIHILTAIKTFQKVEAICKRLDIPEDHALAILKRLEEMELVQRKGDRWEITSKSIHVPKNSIFNWINHSNWRHKAIDSSKWNRVDSIHYSGLYALSQKDSKKLIEMATKFIDSTRKVVEPSFEETLVGFNIDLFPV